MSQLRAQSTSCNPNLGHNHCIVGTSNKSWRRQLRDQTFCFSAWDWFFSSAATKGWEWCKHNAELLEGAATLRNLKLLVRSGCLEFPEGIAGMDALDMSHKSLFGSASHFANMGSWKAGSPASNPRRLKACSSHIVAQSVYCSNSWRPQLRDQTLCFSAWDKSFFCGCNEGMGMMQA